MNEAGFIALGLSVLLTAFGQILIKKGAMEIPSGGAVRQVLAALVRSGNLLGGLFFVLGAPLLYWYSLKTIPLSLAFSINTLTYGLVAFGSRFWLGEGFSKQKILGTMLITLGVIIMGAS